MISRAAFVVAALAAVSCAAVSCAATPATPAPAAHPSTVASILAGARPTGYRLALRLDPDRTHFSGTVEIELDIVDPRAELAVHAKELDLRATRLRQGEREWSLDPELDKESEVVRWGTPGDLRPGPARLRVEYRAPFGPGVGIFREAVEGAWYVFSDFQPVDARRAFPCVDEPHLRTPFTVEVDVPAGSKAVGNQPIAEETRDGDRLRVLFETTPPLPTYLVAVAVGPFDIVAGAAEPVPLRAVVPRGHSERARRALERMPRYMSWLRSWTGIDPPVAKLDLVAVPHLDGAMENHGVFTFSADILLSPRRPSVVHTELQNMVLAHEASHLWFGNLAGFDDWGTLWLSEGFATLMADRAEVELHPEEPIELRQMVYRRDAMALDRRPDVRAVEEVPAAARGPETAFDALSYKKAGAVLGAARAFLGETEFRAAIRRYLLGVRRGEVGAPALYHALSGQGPQAASMVRALMSRPGIPSVRARVECGGKGAVVELAQRRMTRQGGVAAEPWPLPICVAHGGDTPAPMACTVMHSERQRLELDTCPRWVWPNAGGDAYVHVELSGAEVAVLAAAPLSPREQAALLVDVELAIDAGTLEPEDAVPALLVGLRSDDPHRFELALSLAQALLVDLQGERRQGLATALSPVIAQRARAIGFGDAPDRPLAERVHRAALLRLAGIGLADELVRDRARRVAERALRGAHGPEPFDAVQAALAIYAHDLKPDDAARVAEGFSATAGSDQLMNRVGVLASVGRPDSAARVLDVLGVRHAVIPALLYSYAERRSTAAAALAYAAANPHPVMRVGRAVLREGLGRGLCSELDRTALDRALPAPDDGGRAVAADIAHCAARRARWNRPRKSN